MSVFAAGADNHISACVPTVRYSWIAKGEKKIGSLFFLTFQQSICHTS